ncbi:hypothetical protein O181_045594 [Austropuccinia psidii MF-1]|uniref:Uncharacterized protein n=1 Tax=Austropuccinia psidii MF-1 TaxID=1389203 RepID=A0A9Q3DMB9_9BASI|nr:hypothetical protein [Austropuccinia psidii MF-1]
MVVDLSKLPKQVIKTLFELEPSLVHLFLVGLGSKQINRLATSVIYQSILIKYGLPLHPKLLTILDGPDRYGAAVECIKIVDPSSSFESILDAVPSPPSSPSSLSSSIDLSSHNLSSSADHLIRLLKKLPNLKTFSWSANSLPTDQICRLMGLYCQNLENFSIDIPNVANSSSNPQSSTFKPLPSTSRRRAHTTNESFDDPDSDSDLIPRTLRPIRWDANSIDLLPSTLTQLFISSLSSIGAKALSQAFETLNWTGLIKLNLSKSLFIDDELMSSISLGAKKLKQLTIESMSGTKLTERGIEHLFNGLDELEMIELIDVEGRFSKNGWLKFQDLPPNLKAIKFGYHEHGSYHSWTLDHLQNIMSLLSLYPQKLEKLSIARLVPPPAMIPGRHSFYPELAISNRAIAKRIPKEQILTIVEEGKQLKQLNLNWWLMSIEGLEVIVKGLPNLTKLTALIDAPFHRIISSTAFAHSKIKTLVVSIPPEHTPFVQELMLTPLMPLANTSSNDPLSPPINQISQVLSPGPSLSSSPILTRDMKKFIKRAGQLTEIVWTGRGGLGSWKFIRNGASSVNVKVEFKAISDQLPAEAFEYEQQQVGVSAGLGYHHQRTGSTPWHGSPPVQLGCRQGTRILSSGRPKRRTSSVTTTTEASTPNDSQEFGRKSSSGSLSTSWSSHYLTGNLHKLDLERIPGTPAGEMVDENERKKILINQGLSEDNNEVKIKISKNAKEHKV